MAITSADPDNDPNTPRPALSFGTAFNVDGDADGNQSLRAEFPDDTGSSSLSEYYRGEGLVPDTGGTVFQSARWSTDSLIEYNPLKKATNPTNAYLDTLDEPVVPNGGLYYVRRVTAAGEAALSSIVSSGGNLQEGDLIFAWGARIDENNLYAYSFIIPNGIIGQSYTNEGYEYTTGGDASGNTVEVWIGPILGAPTTIDLRAVIWNSWFDTYYIRRRVAPGATEINSNVPEEGSPISFSQLYGSKRFFEGSANIPGHNVSDTSNSYIWEPQNFPANITTDGTDVRSGRLPNSLRYASSSYGTLPVGFTTYNVPMGTFYIDPATFIGNIKLTLSPLDSSTGDIRYYGGVDDDGGNAYVTINEVGIRIQNVDSGNDALVYKGTVAPEFTGTGTNGSGRSFSRYLSLNLQSVFTDESETITETGRFIVYLTFGYRQFQAYGDPDFALNIDAVKVSWETA